MQKIFLIIITCLLCFSCGVKNDPEYKSQIDNNKIIHLTKIKWIISESEKTTFLLKTY